MGLGIGDSLSGSAARPAPQRGTGRAANSPPGQEDENRRPARQAGFGANTISPANAAVDAIDQTVGQAADAVPSLEELAEQTRDRIDTGAAIAETRLGEEDANAGGPQPQQVRPEPSPQVRNFEQAEAIPRNTEEREAPEEEVVADNNPAANRLDVFA